MADCVAILCGPLELGVGFSPHKALAPEAEPRWDWLNGRVYLENSGFRFGDVTGGFSYV